MARVKAASSEFFERLVVELLLKMGCGGSRKDAGEAIGKSGDEGIDGVISEDRLGLDVVYLQAKRWDGTVGRPELLARVGLSDRMEHKPTELSGGQMQRVAIARAMAMRPDVILADEPTGNLDSTSGSDIMQLFSELREQGRTMIVITHDMWLARRAARVIEVHDGRILANAA